MQGDSPYDTDYRQTPSSTVGTPHMTSPAPTLYQSEQRLPQTIDQSQNSKQTGVVRVPPREEPVSPALTNQSLSFEPADTPSTQPRSSASELEDTESDDDLSIATRMPNIAHKDNIVEVENKQRPETPGGNDTMPSQSSTVVNNDLAKQGSPEVERLPTPVKEFNKEAGLSTSEPSPDVSPRIQHDEKRRVITPDKEPESASEEEDAVTGHEQTDGAEDNADDEPQPGVSARRC